MANLEMVVRQLKAERDRAAREVQQLDAALAALNGAAGAKQTGRGTLSAAARARIAAAQRERWRKVKAGKSQAQNGAKRPKRIVSAATRRKLAAVQRARWAKVRAAKKA